MKWSLLLLVAVLFALEICINANDGEIIADYDAGKVIEELSFIKEETRFFEENIAGDAAEMFKQETEQPKVTMPEVNMPEARELFGENLSEVIETYTEIAADVFTKTDGVINEVTAIVTEVKAESGDSFVAKIIKMPATLILGAVSRIVDLFTSIMEHFSKLFGAKSRTAA